MNDLFPEPPPRVTERNRERTNWRDQAISARHRKWGIGCPMTDIDFICIEYKSDVPVALIEYKHFSANELDIRSSQYRAIAKLGDGLNIPVLVARYLPAKTGQWKFELIPLNDRCRKYFPDRRDVYEIAFIRWLYRLRNQAMPDSVTRDLELL